MAFENDTGFKPIRKIRSLSRRTRLVFSNKNYRRKLWAPVPKLSQRHVANCRVAADRIKMLEELPKHGVCVEVGVYKAEFSERILRILQPKKLYLIDIDLESIQIAKEKFASEIERSVVEVRHEDSVTAMSSMPDKYFDWIYIDANHSYQAVKSDLAVAHKKLKDDGLISMNDYIYFGSSDFSKYGVIEAVNEFCMDRNYELLWLALHGRMYNDVTLRKMNSS